MHTMGEESIMAVAMPVTMLVAPGPEVAMATPTLPRRAGVAVGHVGRALFVADEHMVDLRILGHRVVGRKDRAARVTEDDVNAFPLVSIPK